MATRALLSALALLVSVHGSVLETYADKLKRQLAINSARRPPSPRVSSRVNAGRALGGSADNFFVCVQNIIAKK